VAFGDFRVLVCGSFTSNSIRLLYSEEMANFAAVLEKPVNIP